MKGIKYTDVKTKQNKTISEQCMTLLDYRPGLPHVKFVWEMAVKDFSFKFIHLHGI